MPMRYPLFARPARFAALRRFDAIRRVAARVFALAAVCTLGVPATHAEAQGGNPPPPVVLNFTINNGAATTNTDQVVLRFQYTHSDGANDIQFVQIRTRSPLDRTWQQWGQWDLGSRLRGQITTMLTRRNGVTPIPGMHQFQIRLRDKWDQESAIATATITRVDAPTVNTPPPPPQSEVTCDVNPFQAYQAAQAKGWGFRCVETVPPPPMHMTSINPKFAFIPPSVGCRYGNGVPLPVPPVLRALFFEHPSGSINELRNGWRVKEHVWERSPAESNNQIIPPHPPVPTSARVLRVALASEHGVEYDLKLTKLVLSKQGGSCSAALSEAF